MSDTDALAEYRHEWKQVTGNMTGYECLYCPRTAFDPGFVSQAESLCPPRVEALVREHVEVSEQLGLAVAGEHIAEEQLAAKDAEIAGAAELFGKQEETIARLRRERDAAMSQTAKIAAHPAVLARAGVGDGACGDAVIAVCGALEVAEKEREEAQRVTYDRDGLVPCPKCGEWVDSPVIRRDGVCGNCVCPGCAERDRVIAAMREGLERYYDITEDADINVGEGE
jgi:hypothetical protein